MNIWFLFWFALAYAVAAFAVIRTGGWLAKKREQRHLNELYMQEKYGRKRL